MTEMRSVRIGGTVYGSVPNRNKSSTTTTNENELPLLIREEDRFRMDTPYQDKLFAALFVIYLLLIMILSIFFFVQNKSTWSKDGTNSNNEYLNEHFWKLTMASIGISIFNAICLLILIAKFAYFLIWFSLILSFCLLLIYGIITLIIFESIWIGIIILLIALIELIWIFFIKNRIEFATALIMLSIDGLNKFSSTYFISIFGIFLQIFWLIFWMIGFSYSIDGTQSTQIVIILYIFAYYWTFQVISNIVLCSICGIISVWYFLYPQYYTKDTVYNSFKRSITTSFGSICFGSLIITIIQTIGIFIKIINSLIIKQRKNGKSLLCIKQILDYVEMHNNYLFVRISIYGINYCNSAKQTLQLFKTRGLDLIINDDLTNSILLLSCLLSSLFTAICIGLLSKYEYNNNSIETIILWSFTGFFISFAISIIVMVNIKAGVNTIFVSFAEDPASLSFTKPLKYEMLTTEWNKRYGHLPAKLTNPSRI